MDNRSTLVLGATGTTGRRVAQRLQDAGYAGRAAARGGQARFDEGFFRPAVLAGELALPLGEARQVFVDAEDIAAVAVAALIGDGHAGRTYALTGPRALSFAQAVAAEVDAGAKQEPRRPGGRPPADG
jgi:uncharacterized protein YbjT (DUF2867 family)